MKNKILPPHFYQDDDVVRLSQALLGKVLFTQIDNQITSGIIVETEAYRGVEDKACHAYNNRRTARTEIMYAKGGITYIYLCYGLHHLLNIVTADQDTPHAVLIRALEPVTGIPIMLERRNMNHCEPRLTGGPGMLCQAMGITRKLNGYPLIKAPIWLEDQNIQVAKSDIIASARVGINYAQEHKDYPWRFRLRNSQWVSK